MQRTFNTLICLCNRWENTILPELRVTVWLAYEARRGYCAGSHLHQQLVFDCKLHKHEAAMHYWWEHYNVYCIAPSVCVRGVFVSDSGNCAKKQTLFILIPPVFWCTCLFSLFENECDKRFDFLSLDLSVIFCWHDCSESFWRIDSLRRRQNLRPFFGVFYFGLVCLCQIVNV